MTESDEEKKMKNKLEIYLIRHGESHHNKHTMHIIGGNKDDSPLTKYGKIQAVHLGHRLAIEDISFDKIYSSTAQRAKDTAEKVSQQIDYPITDIILKSQLLEYNPGDHSGRIRAEIYTPEFKEYLDTHSWGYQAPNGESQSMVAHRMYSALEEMIGDAFLNEHERIAIFSHGTAIKCLLKKIMGFDAKYVFRTDIGNTSITELHYDKNDGFAIKRINDTAHVSNISQYKDIK